MSERPANPSADQGLAPAAEEHPTDWYVLRGRARGGPYAYAMVREGTRGGLISKNDLLWRPGLGDWRDAGAIDDLFAATAADREAAPPEPSKVQARPAATGSAAPSIPYAAAAPMASAANPDHGSFNYVMAHWRGEFSPLAAFFGNGTIVGLILLIGATILVTVPKDNKLTPTQYTVMIAALVAICLVSVVWLLVGICRSARRRWARPSAGARSGDRCAEVG
jgi:hypothetical protein